MRRVADMWNPLADAHDTNIAVAREPEFMVLLEARVTVTLTTRAGASGTPIDPGRHWYGYGDLVGHYVHGGPHPAVYAYPSEHYDRVRELLDVSRRLASWART